MTIPVVGELTTPAALLIRPDGHVAWTALSRGAIDAAALRSALTAWFGAAR